MSGLGTGHGVARGGLVGSAGVSRAGADRVCAGSFDDIADATIDRFGHPSDGIHACLPTGRWVLQCLGIAGLIKGKTLAIDATTLEANAALRSIVRRDTGDLSADRQGRITTSILLKNPPFILREPQDERRSV